MVLTNASSIYFLDPAFKTTQTTQGINLTNVMGLTSDSGQVTDRVEYSLYATTTYRVGTNDIPFLFNGRYGVQSDPNGLLFMRARYYSPYLCRFINPDPSGFSGGLNFYAYASGNPISYLDPRGLNSATTGDTSFDWSLNNNQNGSASGNTVDPNDPLGLKAALNSSNNALENSDEDAELAILSSGQDDWVDKTIDYVNGQIDAHDLAAAQRYAQLTPLEQQIIQGEEFISSVYVPEGGAVGTAQQEFSFVNNLDHVSPTTQLVYPVGTQTGEALTPPAGWILHQDIPLGNFIGPNLDGVIWAYPNAAASVQGSLIFHAAENPTAILLQNILDSSQ